LKIGQ